MTPSPTPSRSRLLPVATAGLSLLLAATALARAAVLLLPDAGLGVLALGAAGGELLLVAVGASGLLLATRRGPDRWGAFVVGLLAGLLAVHGGALALLAASGADQRIPGALPAPAGVITVVESGLTLALGLALGAASGAVVLRPAPSVRRSEGLVRAAAVALGALLVLAVVLALAIPPLLYDTERLLSRWSDPVADPVGLALALASLRWLLAAAAVPLAGMMLLHDPGPDGPAVAARFLAVFLGLFLALMAVLTAGDVALRVLLDASADRPGFFVATAARGVEVIALGGIVMLFAKRPGRRGTRTRRPTSEP